MKTPVITEKTEVVVTERLATCDLETLFDASANHMPVHQAKAAFAGTPVVAGLRVNVLYGHDTRMLEIHFSNSELLYRYCSMSALSQEQFIHAIKRVSKDNKADIIDLHVLWGSKKTRTIRIELKDFGSVIKLTLI